MRRGTFTLSNVGMVRGVGWATPIVHLPQAAILATGRIEPKPVVRDGAIVYGLGALKNVGLDAMQLIVQARRIAHPPSPASSLGTAAAMTPVRAEERPFASLFDFARRVDLKRIGKRPLEMLARAGAFDSLDPNRARVFEALDPLVAYSAAVHEAQASAQNSLFGSGGADIPEPRLPFRDDWLPVERLAQEHQAVGFYLSGHPLDDYMSALKRKGVETLAQVTLKAERGPCIAKLAGSVSSRQERKSARGNRFALWKKIVSGKTGLYLHNIPGLSDAFDVFS